MNDMNAPRNAVAATPMMAQYLEIKAAREWAPKQVCCNVICPGAQSEAFRRVMTANPQMAATMAEANPMGRIGDPLDDIGPVAVFLASDDSRYVTGNTLFVDGGSHINGVQWAPQVD